MHGEEEDDAVISHESATFRGGAATFAGGWPDELRCKAFGILSARNPNPETTCSLCMKNTDEDDKKQVRNPKPYRGTSPIENVSP